MFVHKLVCKGYVDRYISRGVHKIYMIPIFFKSAREEFEKINVCLTFFQEEAQSLVKFLVGDTNGQSFAHLAGDID